MLCFSIDTGIHVVAISGNGCVDWGTQDMAMVQTAQFLH